MKKSYSKRHKTVKEGFWNYIEARLYSIYGLNPPPEAIERLETERARFGEDSRLMSGLLFCGMLRETVDAANSEMLCRGSVNNLFLGWLTGATRVNPLRPHYYCKKCKNYEMISGVGDGWDLKEKKCKCGACLTRDGHWLAPPTQDEIKSIELLIPGFMGERAGSLLRKFYASIEGLDVVRTIREVEPERVPEEKKSGKLRVWAWALQDWASCETEIKPYFTFTASNVSKVEFVRELSKKTGFIPTIEDCLKADVLHSFREDNAYRRYSQVGDEIDLTYDDRFSDILRAFGLKVATFYNSDNTPFDIRELPAFRDDIYNYLQLKMQKTGVGGIDYATRASQLYGKGKIQYNEHWLCVESLNSIGVEDEYIECLEKIKYLFPRGYLVEALRIDLMVAWYRLHYPDEFNIFHAES